MSSRFGFWAALGALVASLAYGIPQILQVAGVLHDPWDRILIFAPSLALALAIMYAVLVSIVYVTQLGVVIPRDLRGDGANVALLACCGQNQFLTGVDLLGYTLMSLATLFAAPVFSAPGARPWTRRWLIANGVLAPFLIAQIAWPGLIVIGALWLITFPVAMGLLALGFGRRR